MVEKRTLVFLTLATIVWASITTGFTAYYYLEQGRYKEQVDEKQQMLNELDESYDAAITKKNLLSGEYGMLLGDYQWFIGENYSLLMGRYEELLSNLNNNYSTTLNEFPELNTTYHNLSNEFQTLNAKGNVTREEFGSLLDSFYKLFTTLVMKELGGSLAKASKIQVSLCINYTKLTGEPSLEWHNISISAGTTLFDLTQEVATIEYSYYATMEPGHIIISAINNNAAWWIWHYWDETINDWGWGPVGCDAWILKNNGIYKWDVF